MPKKEALHIKVPVDDYVLERLDEVIPVISESAAAREFGVEVTREMVARMALVRGLKDLRPPPPASTKQPTPPQTANSTPSQATEAPSEPEAPRDNAGMIRIPDGWHQWGIKERVPEGQSDVHSYYDRQGWRRYWGKAGDETMVFYWSPDPSLQDVEAYDGQDSSGKTIKVQETPYGPGHIVPHGWGS
jgi:hypothetical protein